MSDPGLLCAGIPFGLVMSGVSPHLTASSLVLLNLDVSENRQLGREGYVCTVTTCRAESMWQ
jgi:hypothetical protein